MPHEVAMIFLREGYCVVILFSLLWPTALCTLYFLQVVTNEAIYPQFQNDLSNIPSLLNDSQRTITRSLIRRRHYSLNP